MADPWTPVDRRDPSVLASALRAHPTVGVGVLATPRKGRLDLRGMVPFLDSGAAQLETLLTELGLGGLRLLQMASFHGGVDRATVLAENPNTPPEDIDRVASDVVIAGLARMVGDRLVVHPDVIDGIPLPHPRFTEWAEYVTLDRLHQTCSLLGVPGGTRKNERVAAIASVLRDPEHLGRALRAAGEPARALFGEILLATRDGVHQTSLRSDEPHSAVPLDGLVPYEERRRFTGYSRNPSLQHRFPLDELVDRGLIGATEWRSSVWMWAEVMYALTGTSAGDWPPEPPLVTASLDSATAAPVRIGAAFSALVDHFRDHPVEGKKSGDRHPPVRAWRGAAKAVGITAPLGEILGEIAVDLGLLYAGSLRSRGRGRNVEHPIEWRTNLSRRGELAERSPAESWLAIVSTWHSGSGSSSDLEVLGRTLVWSALANLPPGRGAPRADLVRWLRYRHLSLSATDLVPAILEQLVELGLASRNGEIVGLTDAARAAPLGGEALAATIGGQANHFVVQPDHSVVAPPDLDPGVSAQLSRIADLTSEGGATVWRLSSARLARESARQPAAHVVEFLARHSSVPVPDAVARFVSDAMSVARVSLADAATVITCPDPVVVADLARYKALKLTVVAPGVAVSMLSSSRLAPLLADKGAALGSAPDVGYQVNVAGSTGTGVPRISDAAHAWIVTQRDPNSVLAPARPVPIPASVDEIADRILGPVG